MANSRIPQAYGYAVCFITVIMMRFDSAMKEPWNSKLLRARPYVSATEQPLPIGQTR